MTLAHIPSDHTISALIIGEGDLTWRCIHQILNQGLRVSALISGNSNLVSRAHSHHFHAFHIQSPSPFLIPAEEDASNRIISTPACLESIEFDVIISVENSLLIPEALLARSRLGLIQFYPGNPNHNFDLHPLSWALIRQDISHQISWCHLEHASAHPKLIASESVPLAPTDTLESLLERVHLKALTSLKKVVTQVLPTVSSTPSETHNPRQQNRSTPFQRHPGLTWIDWMWSASLIQNLVRATHSLPSINTFGLVKFHHHSQFFIVRECHTVSIHHPVSDSAAPGTVLNYSPDGLTVQTAEGAVLLSTIQKLNGQLVEFPQLFSTGDQLIEPHSMDLHSTQHLRAEKWIHETAEFEFFWADHIQKSQPFDLPAYWFSHPKHPESSAASQFVRGDSHCMPLWAPDLDGEFEVASWLSGILAAFLARLTGQFHLSISVTSRSLFPTDRQWSQLICPYIPVPWNIQSSLPLQECWWDNRSLVHSLSSAGPFLLDLILRLDPDAPSAQSTSRFHSLCNAFIGTASDFSHLPSLPVLGIEMSENYRFKFIASSHSLHTALALALCHAFDNFFFSLSENPGLELPWLNLGNPGQVRRLNETFHFHADPDTVITSLIEGVLDRYPDQPAVESSLGTLTYSELWQKAGHIAASLQSMGCQYSDHVGIHLDRSPDFVASLVGCLRAGACAVLLSTAQPPERLRQMATSASLLYLIADFSDPTLVPEWADGLKILQPAHASPNPISHIRKVSFDYSSHAYIIFTSGSTGNPKPVLVGHRELLHHALAFQNALDLTPKDRVLQFAGLGFDVCLEEIFPTLAVGARIILLNDSLINTAKDFWKFVSLHSITLLNLPTAFWYSLVDESSSDMIPHTVRNLIVGGERVDAVYLERWFQLNPSRIRWWNGYGPTETTITATLISVDSPLDDTPPGNTVPIGFGLGCCDIFLLDAFGKPLPPGLPGEILVCGAGVARGYFNQPDLTSQRFVEAPLVGRSVEHSRAYQTGDYGCILENGCLHFLGRNDSQVKIRGFRLELHDIEKNIEALEGVDQAIVLDFVRPGSSSSALAAFIKLSKNSNSSIKNIRLEMAQRLPDYMIPSSFSEILHWPMTPNGKIHLKELRNLALSAFATSDLSESSPASLPSQSSPLLNSITQAWKDVLNQAPHSLNQNFFESGGDSLAAMRLLSRISQSANQPVSLSDFYDVPTIQGLLNLLSPNPLSSASSSPVHRPHRWFVSLSQSSNAIPVFIIPGGAGGDVETLIYKAITEKIGPGFTFLAFQPLQSGMDKFPFSSVSDLANACVAEMNAIHPHGPYFIIADCIGSILSFEIVASLEKSGKSIAMLALLDSQPGYHRDAASPPRHSKLKPLLDRFHRLVLHISSLIRTHPFHWLDYLHSIRQKHHIHAELLENIHPNSHTTHHPQALGSAFFDLLVHHNPSKISSHIDDYLPTTKKSIPINETWQFLTTGSYQTFFYEEALESNYIGRPLDYVRDRKLLTAPILAQRLTTLGAKP